MKDKFEDMRLKFGSAFMQVKRIFTKRKLSIEDMKELIIIWYPDLEPQLSYKKTIGEVLNVLKRKCNIINLRPLEALASEFNIEEAKPVIKSYKEEAKNFCKSISVSLCLGEELQAVATPSRLLCETVSFIFNWNPDEYTLQDINDVLDELEPLNKFKYHLQIDKVGTGRSVVLACYCPAEYTGSLIMAVLGKIEILQKRGLKDFILGNCTIWNTTQIPSENTEGTDKLLVQINDLEAALRDRDEMLITTKTELATVKEELGNIIKELEALKMNLKKSQSINVLKEEVINELKEERASLKEKLLEKENMLKQYSKETELKETEDFEKEASLKEQSETRLQEIELVKLKLEDSDTQVDEKVKWSPDGLRVHLTNPSVDQCKEVISKLENKHEIVKISCSSSDSIQFILRTVFETKNITQFYLISSSLTPDIILSFPSQLWTNNSLKILSLTRNSISDDGVIALAQSLKCNETLKYLHFSKNPGITSASAESLAELLCTNNTLSSLYLTRSTSIDTDGVVVLMESLKTNDTLEELWLDKKHKKTCTTLPYYGHIKDTLHFL
ncbi:PREDICTED: uncharacterized protein LOC109584685 [Amphimedon queenslandica]|uniref:Death domain-containing protein n=1 Tax=Amphimedon queenslandica TaxID=400682 RepID=A0AAN0JHC7_AMPQE|nr:PREDICTED: uncharacterized protein LOC109584685 [Amphimedon queenslandica]|eukprot:XP_019856063.1 PREDICTED: uncharacterized protein LOC109584685 [Amphimedon queenslandica]